MHALIFGSLAQILVENDVPPWRAPTLKKCRGPGASAPTEKSRKEKKAKRLKAEHASGAAGRTKADEAAAAKDIAKRTRLATSKSNKRPRPRIETPAAPAALAAPPSAEAGQAVHILFNQRARRYQIARAYVDHHLPAEETWLGKGGKGGIATEVAKTFVCKVETVTTGFAEVRECWRKGIQCHAKRKSGSGTNNVKLVPGSEEEQLAADLREGGASYQFIMERINKPPDQPESELDLITWSAVRNGLRRLKPDVSAVQRHKQGSNDPNSRWAVRRLVMHSLYLR